MLTISPGRTSVHVWLGSVPSACKGDIAAALPWGWPPCGVPCGELPSVALRGVAVGLAALRWVGVPCGELGSLLEIRHTGSLPGLAARVQFPGIFSSWTTRGPFLGALQGQVGALAPLKTSLKCLHPSSLHGPLLRLRGDSAPLCSPLLPSAPHPAAGTSRATSSRASSPRPWEASKASSTLGKSVAASLTHEADDPLRSPRSFWMPSNVRL